MTLITIKIIIEKQTNYYRFLKKTSIFSDELK